MKEEEKQPRRRDRKFSLFSMKGRMSLIILCLGFLITGCTGSDKATRIVIKSESTVVDIHQEIDVLVDTDPSDYDLTKFVIVSSNPDVIKEKEITKDTMKLMSLDKEGSVKIYVEEKNGEKSNEITITVEDKEKQEQIKKEAEKKAAEEQKRAEEQAAKEAEEKRLAEEEAQRLAEEQAAIEAAKQEEAQTQNLQSQTQQITVYIPRTGSKYHARPNCGNMKNPSTTTLENAQARGYEPCKKCY